MKKLIKIFYFETADQDRIAFVRLMAEHNPNIGLKAAKGLQDQMLKGLPIEYEITSDRLQIFIQKLEYLKLRYSIIE